MADLVKFNLHSGITDYMYNVNHFFPGSEQGDDMGHQP